MRFEAVIGVLLIYFSLFKFFPILDHLLILALISFLLILIAIILFLNPKYTGLGKGMLMGIGITLLICIILSITFFFL